MKWLSDHVETLVLLAIVVLVTVLGHLDEKRCADHCGPGGYTYRDGCGPATCVCGAADAGSAR